MSSYSSDMVLKSAFQYELLNVHPIKEIPEGREAQEIIVKYFKRRIKEIDETHNQCERVS